MIISTQYRRVRQLHWAATRVSHISKAIGFLRNAIWRGSLSKGAAVPIPGTEFELRIRFICRRALINPCGPSDSTWHGNRLTRVAERHGVKAGPWYWTAVTVLQRGRTARACQPRRRLLHGDIGLSMSDHPRSVKSYTFVLSLTALHVSAPKIPPRRHRLVRCCLCLKRLMMPAKTITSHRRMVPIHMSHLTTVPAVVASRRRAIERGLRAGISGPVTTQSFQLLSPARGNT